MNEEADLEKPETIVIDADYMHLQDLGSTAYTEFDNDADLIDLYEEREELMERRCGLIHSHHTMKAFFSGTDQEELHEKAETGLYLSLIVNNYMEPVAKLAWMGEMERTTEQYTSWQWGMFKRDRKKYTRTEMCNVIYEIEFDIEFDECATPSFYCYAELEEEENIVATAKSVHNNGFGVGTHGRQGDIFGMKNPLVDRKELPHDGSKLDSDKSLTDKLIDDFKINKAFAVIMTQDPKTNSPGIHSSMTIAMQEVKNNVEALVDTKLTPSEYEALYTAEAKAYATQLIADGDDLIAEWLNEFFISDDDYYAILGKMYDGLTGYSGIFSEMLRLAIVAVTIDDDDDDDDLDRIIIVDEHGKITERDD